MADRKIDAFKVQAPLFNDIVAVLLALPASTSRELLNRIENADECEPIFKVDLQPPQDPPEDPPQDPDDDS